MTSARAYAKLLDLRVPVIEGGEAAAILGLSGGSTSKLMGRLEEAGLVSRIHRGLWGFGKNPDPFVVASFITAPLPAYVSLQSALQIHGLISQIPVVIYVVSIGRTHRIKTRIATYSVHRIAPELFGGFETTDKGAKIARPEKALVDMAYLGAGQSRLMSGLPELEIPPTFDRGAAREWIEKIPSARLRYGAEKRLAALMRVAS